MGLVAWVAGPTWGASHVVRGLASTGVAGSGTLAGSATPTGAAEGVSGVELVSTVESGTEISPVVPEPGVVSGMVLHPASGDPAPLPGAAVWAFRAGRHHQPELMGMTASGDDGSFAFASLPPGGYLLVVSAADYAPQARHLPVRPGETTDCTFVLLPVGAPEEFGTLEGCVTGVTEDGDEIPLPGAHLVLLAADVPIREAVAGDDGCYAMEGVPPGEFLLRAGAPGFAPAEATVVVVAHETTEQNFVLQPPEDGAITGCVSGLQDDGTQVPLPGAHVVLIRHTHVVRQVTAGDDGCFAMTDVPPGVYGLGAGAEGYRPVVEPIEVASGESVEHSFVLEPLPPPPPPREGACCLGEECVVLPPRACHRQGGEYQGDGTGCDPNPCTE